MDILKVISFFRSRLGQAILGSAAEIIERYFRIEVEGLENIPDWGSAIIFPNHSGYAGADAMMLVHLINKHKGRTPVLLAHRGYFEWVSAVRLASESFGLREANYKTGLELLREGELVVVFPEGEAGNFKSSLRRYQLQRFHTGFIRMALQGGAPLVPCIITGAEEAHLNLGSVDLSKICKDLRIPIPLNLIPLPSKWKIQFLKPLDLDHLKVMDLEDSQKMREASERIRFFMQGQLDEALRQREYVFFK